MQDTNANAFFDTYNANPDQWTFLDVRETNEWDMGHLAVTESFPLSQMTPEAIAERLPNMDAHIAVHCASGNRSGTVTELLTSMGYMNVTNIADSFDHLHETFGS